MRSIVIAVFIVVVLLLGLAASCPDEGSFDRFIEKSTKREHDPLLAKAEGALKSAQAKLTADYKDHVLWATVEARQGMRQARYLGVCGMWFELSGD